MKKIFKEFKDFISKGSVIDLAVGMIIGAAFTAIVTALVNGILKPLINWIPLGETGLQTVLKEAVTNDSGEVLVDAIVLDWGGVISAIITFLLTAVVLFVIIKAFNKAKETGAKVKEKAENAIEARKAKDEQETVEQVTEEAVSEPQEPIVEEKSETTEELLKQIVELLKNKE